MLAACTLSMFRCLGWEWISGPCGTILKAARNDQHVSQNYACSQFLKGPTHERVAWILGDREQEFHSLLMFLSVIEHGVLAITLQPENSVPFTSLTLWCRSKCFTINSQNVTKTSLMCNDHLFPWHELHNELFQTTNKHTTALIQVFGGI